MFHVGFPFCFQDPFEDIDLLHDPCRSFGSQQAEEEGGNLYNACPMKSVISVLTEIATADPH